MLVGLTEEVAEAVDEGHVGATHMQQGFAAVAHFDSISDLLKDIEHLDQKWPTLIRPELRQAEALGGLHWIFFSQVDASNDEADLVTEPHEPEGLSSQFVLLFEKKSLCRFP